MSSVMLPISLPRPPLVVVRPLEARESTLLVYEVDYISSAAACQENLCWFVKTRVILAKDKGKSTR